jgi:hypothetical protein
MDFAKSDPFTLGVEEELLAVLTTLIERAASDAG